jgi:hypothetical protein
MRETAKGRMALVGRKSRGERDGANTFDGIAPDLSRLACGVASPLIPRNTDLASGGSLVDSDTTRTTQIRRGINLPAWRAPGRAEIFTLPPIRRVAISPICRFAPPSGFGVWRGLAADASEYRSCLGRFVG